MDNILGELTTAYNLTKAKPTAWKLHELHQTKLKSIRKWLLSELQSEMGECIAIVIDGAKNVSNEDFVDILLRLVNEKRAQEGKEPLAINY